MHERPAFLALIAQACQPAQIPSSCDDCDDCDGCDLRNHDPHAPPGCRDRRGAVIERRRNGVRTVALVAA